MRRNEENVRRNTNDYGRTTEKKESIQGEIECSSCKKIISRDSNFCTYCGKEVTESKY